MKRVPFLRLFLFIFSVRIIFLFFLFFFFYFFYVMVLGHLWCLYSGRRTYSYKQKKCCRKDIQPSWCGCWGTLVFTYLRLLYPWSWSYLVILLQIFLFGQKLWYLGNMMLETGMVLSRNTPCCRNKLSGPLGGPLVVTLVLRW